jgi:aryl-alcohol dehydrogenase-like predicted oxidoreductase
MLLNTYKTPNVTQIPPQTWSNPSTAYERTKAAVQMSLQRIGFPSIDLMLLHAPGAPEGRAEAWRALEDAHKQVNTHVYVKCDWVLWHWQTPKQVCYYIAQCHVVWR